MTYDLSPKLVGRFRILGQILAGLAILVGALNLVGWARDVEVLKCLVPGLRAVAPVAAVAFILAGAAVLLLRRADSPRAARRTGTALALIVVLIGVVRFAGYFTWDTGIDRILFASRLGDNRLSINAAAALVVFAVGLLVVDLSRALRGRAAEWCFVVTGFIGFVALVGYAYRIPVFYGAPSEAPITFGTAVVLVLLSVAGMCLRPERGLMRTLASDTVGGIVARYVILPAAVFPAIVGWLAWLGVSLGIYSASVGVLLSVAAMSVGFAGLVVWASTALRRVDMERRSAMLDLERSNEELEQFAYAASHDLQEPLRTVSLQLQLLKRALAGRLGADEGESLGFAVDAAKRAQRMVKDLLTYSRVGTKGLPFERAEADAVVEEAVRNLRGSIESAHAAVAHAPLPAVVGDHTQLVELFQNLIGNAVKFHGERPPAVEVTARREDGNVVFAVKDNGIGIDPKYSGKLFKVFSRLQPEGQYEGTGIGLAVCRQIVERHGGRIWFESEPGHGATFLFTLPAERKEP